MIKLISPPDGAVISQLTKNQWQFIDNAELRISAEAKDFDYLSLSAEGIDYTRPKPIRFSWDRAVDNAVLQISDNDEFLDAREYKLRGKSKKLYNFSPNILYRWRIFFPGDESFSEIHSFSVLEETPRSLYIPGLFNVRDMGGYRGSFGRIIKYNLLFRGSEMDLHQCISERGKSILANDLKIRTDLDLRQEAVGVIEKSALASFGVNHKLIPCKSYGEFFGEEWKESNLGIFKIFTVKENYPIYMHCWGGSDRTGTVIMLLSAILGISEEDILCDWEFSSLSVWGLRSRNARRFVSFNEALSAYGTPDMSWQEKAMNYLRYIGLDETDFDKIREIFFGRTI